jgi:hypothetical protein
MGKFAAQLTVEEKFTVHGSQLKGRKEVKRVHG